MSDSSHTLEYDEIGIIGSDTCFDKLSEYYHEENQRLDLKLLDKFQEDLDLEIMEWSVYENIRSKILSSDSEYSLLPKYRKKINSFF